MNIHTAAFGEAVTLRIHKHSRRFAVVVTWVLVVILYGPMINQWLEINSHDKQFVESVQDVLRVAAKGRWSPDELRTLLFARAKELSVPIRGNGILVRGEPDMPRVKIHYDAGITVPILNWPAYFFSFRHDV
jgi:hypothetical protein